MITFSRFGFSVLLLTTVFFAGGCLGGSSEELVGLVPVSGKVTLDGAPLTGASVTFMPEGTGMGRPCYGATGEDGSYTIKDPGGREGCPVEKFKVVISKYAKEDGSPVGKDPESAAEGMEHLPEKYSNAEQTQLSAEVPEGGKTFDFDLKTKGKK